MKKINNRVIFLCKCIIIMLIMNISVNDVLCENVIASELPTIELNTKVADNNEETQKKQNKDENDKNKYNENEYKIVDYRNYYIVLGVVGVIALISIILNIILIVDRKKRNEYKKQVDMIKDKYNNDKDINTPNNKIINENSIKNEKSFSSTSMLWKIMIQVYDKKNNIVYDTDFDSSKENMEIKLGRGDKAKVDIKIPLPNISDEHCLILKRGNKYYLKDLNSTNGTKYNGEKVIDKIEINYQGDLNLGRSEFELKILDKQNYYKDE